MKYFVIFLIIIGFVGNASTQYVGDSGEPGNLEWPPVCVKNETKKILVERGWAKPDIRTSPE